MKDHTAPHQLVYYKIGSRRTDGMENKKGS